MMRIRKLVLAAALSAGLFGGAANATTLNTDFGGTGDGLLANFLGFDWAQNASAWIRDFGLTDTNHSGDTDQFTLDFHAYATRIFNSTNLTPNLNIPPPEGAGGGTYEITVTAHLDETAQCTIDGCNSINLFTNSGTFDVYIDYSPDANPSAGTGYTDGTLILEGTFSSGLAAFTSTGTPAQPGTVGSGGGQIFGTVTFSNSDYIDPTLLGAGTTTQTSLNFPGTGTFQRSACFELTPGSPTCTSTGSNTASNFILQADASTTFEQQRVPEPISVSLVGIGLAVMGWKMRRKQS